MGEVAFFFRGWEPVARIIVVGGLAYVALVLLLRVSGKRTLTQMTGFDFIITVALGATFGRILTAQDVALVEAVAAFLLLATLQYAAARMELRSPHFGRFVTASPVLLFSEGTFHSEAMGRENFTGAELRAALRERGIGSFDMVEAIVLEPNGRLAVIEASQMGDGSALEDVRRD
jgi:uncharacterized membrane protein YcaP (DUF421 family)